MNKHFQCNTGVVSPFGPEFIRSWVRASFVLKLLCVPYVFKSNGRTYVLRSTEHENRGLLSRCPKWTDVEIGQKEG